MTAAVVLPKNTKVWRYNEDGELERHCALCDDWWPADREFFGSAPKSFLGLHSHCLACTSERIARRRAVAKEVLA